MSIVPEIEIECSQLVLDKNRRDIVFNLYDDSYNIMGKKILIDTLNDREVAECHIGEMNPSYIENDLCESLYVYDHYNK